MKMRTDRVYIGGMDWDAAGVLDRVRKDPFSFGYIEHET